jgi:glycosyltransferase involved in cell wall biosynthesis
MPYVRAPKMKVAIEGIIGHMIHRPNNAFPFFRNFIYHLPSRGDVTYYLFLDTPTTEALSQFLKREDFRVIDTGRTASKLGRLYRMHVILPLLLRKYGIGVYCSIVTNEIPFFGDFKKIVRISSLAVHHYPSMFNVATTAYRKALDPTIVHKADLVIANSYSMRNDILHHFKVANDNIIMIPEPIDPFWLEDIADDRREKVLGISDPYILFVSGLTRYKNPHTLLNAFWHLKRSGSYPHKLVFVGHGDFESELRQMVQHYELEKEALFAGFVDKDTLRKLYRAANMVVHPSFYEATGNVCLQSMAMGVPLIASNILSIPELTGDAALLFDPHSAEELENHLRDLINNESSRQTLIERGLRRIELFRDWQEPMDQFLSAVTRVVER